MQGKGYIGKQGQITGTGKAKGHICKHLRRSSCVSHEGLTRTLTAVELSSCRQPQGTDKDARSVRAGLATGD